MLAVAVAVEAFVVMMPGIFVHGKVLGWLVAYGGIVVFMILPEGKIGLGHTADCKGCRSKCSSKNGFGIKIQLVGMVRLS